jgi:hypothetical protein
VYHAVAVAEPFAGAGCADGAVDANGKFPDIDKPAAIADAVRRVGRS